MRVIGCFRNFAGYKCRQMISRLIDEKSIKALQAALQHARNIVITCHTSPDGDAVGSSLGLMHVLNATGCTARVVLPDPAPASLRFLPGTKDATVYSKYPEYATQQLNSADILFCLDFNEIKRTGDLADALRAVTCRKVMIDHHMHPDQFADICISYPEVSSTSMLVFRTICRLGLLDYVDKHAAECIYTGMMTDTGNFSYNSNDPDLYIVIAELLRKGIDKDRIYSLAMNTKSTDSLRLNAYAILDRMEIFADHRAALVTLSRDELNLFNYHRGDTESLVNKPLASPDVTYSIFLREEEGYIKVSCRSKGDFPVNKICMEHFGGGGHLNAAGGEFNGTLDECRQHVIDAMPQYDKYLK